MGDPGAPTRSDAHETTPVRAGRFARAASVGGLLAIAVFAWLLTLGQWDLGRAERLGDFYDVQGRAFLEGRWDVPPEAVTIEGIVTDGRTYIYFGPVPSLLRLPVLAATDRFDGRLTAPSLLLAYSTALTGVALLSWRIRALVAGGTRWRRRDAVVAAGTVFFAGTGTVLLFPASRLLVYHEAILWGVAFSLLAYDRILVLVLRPAARDLALASLAATAAFLTRASVGLGPVVALAVVAVVAGIQHLRTRRWSVPTVLAAGAAVAVPVVAFVSVNVVKFETPYSLPLDRQVFSRFDENRQAALRDNGGSLFGPAFVPTTLTHYARPDGLRVTSRFPYVQFPDGADVIGDVTFDTIDRAGSVPATMPAATVLAVVGAVTVVRRRTSRSLLPALAGAVAGASTVLTIGFVAHRYLGDAVPLVLLLALVGLHRLTATRWLAAVVPLALASVVVNLGLALLYQRAYSDNIEPPARAEFLGWQDRWSPGGLEDTTVRGDILSPPVDGDVFVVGPCAGVYWSDGERWHAAERTPATGRLRVRTILRPGVVATDEASGLRVLLERGDDGDDGGHDGDRLVLVAPEGRRFEGKPLRPSELRRPVDLDLAVDRRSAEATAHVDGRLVLDWSFLLLPDVRLTVPAGTPATPLPTPTPLCDQLTEGPGTSS